ncbi:MAG TPA: hypothetical protein VGB94_00570 [Acidobacteriaceae bacterium]
MPLETFQQMDIERGIRIFFPLVPGWKRRRASFQLQLLGGNPIHAVPLPQSLIIFTIVMIVAPLKKQIPRASLRNDKQIGGMTNKQVELNPPHDTVGLNI